MEEHMQHLTQISIIIRKLKEKNITLQPTLSEEDIQEFEVKHNVTLPNDYRLFLQHVGNGGRGPNYGLLPLQESVEYIETEKFKGMFLKLSHEGDEYYEGLALTGEKAGTMWLDNRPANLGLYPLDYEFAGRTIPYYFLDWYDHWIDKGAKCRMDVIDNMFTQLKELEDRDDQEFQKFLNDRRK